MKGKVLPPPWWDTRYGWGFVMRSHWYLFQFRIFGAVRNVGER